MTPSTTNTSILVLLALGSTTNMLASAQAAANCGDTASLCGADKCVKDFDKGSVVCVDGTCEFNTTSLAYEEAVGMGKDLDDLFAQDCADPTNLCGNSGVICDPAASEVCLLDECKKEGIDVFSCADTYCTVDEVCLIAASVSGETVDRCAKIDFQCSLFGDVGALCSDTTNFLYVVPNEDGGSDAQLTASGVASDFCSGGAECTSQGGTPTMAPTSAATTTRFLSLFSPCLVGAIALIVGLMN